MNEIILKSIESSSAKIDEIILIITPMIEDFWTRANELNRKIIRDNHGDSKEIITSRYFPIIDHIGSARKKTIGWHDVSPKYKGPRRNFYTKTIKATGKGYTISCFPKALDWEREMIIEFEKEISPYRDALVVFHEHKIICSRLLRKYPLVK